MLELAGEQTADTPSRPNRARKEWSKEAKCAGLPSLFTGEETRRNVEAVKNICGKCPVFQECLEYALAHEIPGIYAASNSTMRKAMNPDRQVLLQRVPIEPELSDYLKEEAPEVIVKPKKIVFPSSPPKVFEKPKMISPNLNVKKEKVQTLWDDLGETLLGLQSTSWLATPA